MKQTIATDTGPAIDLLLQEYHAVEGNEETLSYDDDIRYTRWTGQSPDGRKWDRFRPDGDPALPWEGASDTRVPLADEIIRERVAACKAAFWRAAPVFNPVNAEDGELAAYIGQYMGWLRNTKMRRQLVREVELSQQYADHYGWCLIYAGWTRRIGVREMPLTMDMALGLLQQAGIDPALIEDPAREAEGLEVFRTLYRTLAQRDGITEEESDQVLPRDRELKRVMRELREDGESSVGVPYVAEDAPCVYACKPWEDVRVPDDTLDIQDARVVFWRHWMDEATLRGKVVSEGWDEDFVDAVIEARGRDRYQYTTYASPQSGALTNATKTDPTTGAYRAVEGDLAEVVYGYRRVVDESGRTSVHVTIFSPAVGRVGSDGEVLHAKHEIYPGQARYPFIAYSREHVNRRLVSSRSIPCVVGTWQAEEKTQRDAINDRSNLDTLPPLVVPKVFGAKFRIGPGAQMPEARAGQMRFLDPPRRGIETAIQTIELINRRTDQYFGRFAENVHPAKVQTMLEAEIGGFFAVWEEVFRHVLMLVVEYGDPEEFMRVTNAPAPIPAELVYRQFDFTLDFDPRELNPEFLKQKLEMISQLVLPEDTAGVVNRAELTKIKLGAIDPSLSKRLVIDQASASQQLFNDVRNELAQMALGNEANYVEEDPTAPTKLQFLQQLVQANPKYQQLLQEDERFKALVDNFVKNLQQSIAQQQNKTIGRLGVAPVQAG